MYRRVSDSGCPRFPARKEVVSSPTAGVAAWVAVPALDSDSLTLQLDLCPGYFLALASIMGFG